MGNNPKTIRLRMWSNTEEALDKLVEETGKTATQLLNEMILHAHSGNKEIDNGNNKDE